MSNASRYLAGVLHGPMTGAVIERSSAVLDRAGHRRDVFMKVGSSDTVSPNFFSCFAGRDVDLDASSALEPTRAWFRQTPAAGTATSFDRQSLAAGVGWPAGRPLEGSPAPIAQEIAAVRPAFAVVMLGTNDTGVGVFVFERNLVRVVDALTTAGVVPVLSTIPARNDSPSADAAVVDMNAAIRAVAQARQVPYVDLWQVLAALPNRGITSDGVHLSVFTKGGRPAPCRFRPEGLAFGMNQRNRLTLEALDRVRRFVVEGEAAEADPPALVGSGTWDDPHQVDQLPFVDDSDTRGGVSVADRYGSFPQDESGPEIVYRIEVPAPTRIRARVFVDEGVDVDLHWMDAPDPARTRARADKTLDLTAQAGTSYLSADTFVSQGQAKAGPYRLTLLAVP